MCLQRLVISRGLPKSRLKDVLDSFQSCTSLGLDVQLKILQALPALAQNYAEDLKAELLAAALQVCATLQNVKIATISGVATATLQQLVVAVFEKVALEDADAKRSKIAAVTEVPGDDGPIPVREAAFDAYRILLDVAYASDGRKTKFVELGSFNSNLGLELIGSCLNSHPRVFATHAELANVLRNLVLPTLINILSERQSFPLTLRAMRILPHVFQHHIHSMPEECEILLGLLTHMIEPEAAPSWKRVMCMEVFRSIYATSGLVIQIYMQFDMQEGKKAIIRDNISSFVRLSTEKPSLVGLGQQSSVPTGSTTIRETGIEAGTVEATGGVAGVVSSSLAVGETNVPGISSQWSLPKTQCIDYLDKAEPPALPETYTYTLVLECLNSLSESLAKVVLPLTVRPDTRSPRMQQSADGQGSDSSDDSKDDRADKPGNRIKRSHSFRARTVPLNPLTLEHIPAAPRIRGIADLIEHCWPAILATSSTFLYAALDNDYYRSLIRSVQRFSQVAGLLELKVARDAFLTTLSKAAMPPNMINASIGGVPQTAGLQGSSVYGSARGMLSVDSSLSSSTDTPTHSRRPSAQEPPKQTLTTRNMLCLRALINLAIAIGPTLDTSFAIILDSVQQADVMLVNARAHGSHSASGSVLNTESAAVQAATLRFFESTADYPNESFLQILAVLCKTLEKSPEDAGGASILGSPTLDPPSTPKTTKAESLATTLTDTPLQSQYRMLLLSKIGKLADLNVARFAGYPATESGWRMLVEQLTAVAITGGIPKNARQLAADIVCRCCVALAQMSTADSSDEVENVQNLALSSLQHLIRELYAQSDDLTGTDLAVHSLVLEAQRTILETSGESLVTGWDIILAGVGSAFRDESTSDLLSIDLGRRAFVIVQIICSDFLPSLPPTSIKALNQLLYQFATQDLDLNMSLTTISLFRDLSGYLESTALAELNKTPFDLVTGLVSDDPDKPDQVSSAALWTSLLTRLREVVAHNKADIRNSAFQTLLNILSDKDLSKDAWHLVLRSLLLRVLEDDTATRQIDLEPGHRGVGQSMESRDQTSRLLISGVTDLVARDIRTIEKMHDFLGDWTALLDVFQKFLSLSSHAINQAIYSALTSLLALVEPPDGTWSQALDKAVELWTANPPKSGDISQPDAQQAAYIAYTDCAVQIHRILKNTMSVDLTDTFGQHLVDCVRRSSLVAYGGDSNSMTQLQTRLVEFLRALPIDTDGIAPKLLDIASTIVAMPFKEVPSPIDVKNPPSFVALSKACMDWLSDLIKSHVKEQALFESGSIERALHSICIPIEIKYNWKKPGKEPAPWKKATSTALDILPLILSTTLTSSPGIDAQVCTLVWDRIASIACAIMQGDYTSLNVPDSYADIVAIEDDEQSDAKSLLALRDTVLPHLGSPAVSDSVRQKYVQGLFTASLVHAAEPGEYSESSPLDGLVKVRFGRVHDPEPIRREDLAYFCFSELMSMVSAAPAGISYNTSTTFETPYSPAKDYGDHGDARTKSNLACAAAPWLLLRFALPIKAYVADQPLRGSMPMPLSMVEELLWTLERMRCLRMHESITSTGNSLGGVVEDDGKAHLRRLYPILIKAVGVAGHKRSGDGTILSSLMNLLDTIGNT